MKKLLLVLLALLILAGCGEKSDGKSGETTAPAEETVYTGTYEKDSQLEKDTAGAVRQYRPDGTGYTRVTAMASQLLLIAEGETTELMLLSGLDGTPGAAVTLEQDLSQTYWQVTETGFLYYDRENQQLLCLDNSLTLTQTLSMPDEMDGEPVISDDGDTVFYCQGMQLRALDIAQGIDRLVRSHVCVSQDVLGSFFDGTVIRCRVVLDDGSKNELYISAEDGSVLWENPGITELTTSGERYYAHRTDGATVQYLCGKRDGTAQQFYIPQDTVPALAMNLLVGISHNDSGTVLTCYSADTGYRTAEITLPGMDAPLDIWADSRNQRLWLLMPDDRLLSWDPAASAVADKTAFAGPLYTRENPDTAALEALQTRVDGINEKHGVTVQIWKNAVQNPGTHSLEQEYQPTNISTCLDQLELCLDRFPEDFLKKSVSSGLRICLVRSVDGNAEAVQYWAENAGYIALACSGDVQYEFLKALGYVVDVHILGNSPMVDSWELLNPEDFTYGTGAEPGEAFPCPEATVSVTDDRACVFLYAMRSGNEEIFASEIMQKKLLTLCKAIRDAWGWEKKSDVYPWEQYLQESIAYKR